MMVSQRHRVGFCREELRRRVAKGVRLLIHAEWEPRHAKSTAPRAQGEFSGQTRAMLLTPLPNIVGFRLAATNSVVRFTTVNEGTYILVGRTDAGSGNWGNLVIGMVGTSGIVAVTSPAACPTAHSITSGYGRLRLSAGLKTPPERRVRARGLQDCWPKPVLVGRQPSAGEEF